MAIRNLIERNHSREIKSAKCDQNLKENKNLLYLPLIRINILQEKKVPDEIHRIKIEAFENETKLLIKSNTMLKIGGDLDFLVNLGMHQRTKENIWSFSNEELIPRAVNTAQISDIISRGYANRLLHSKWITNSILQLKIKTENGI